MLNFLIPVDGSEPSKDAVEQLLNYRGWMKEDVNIHLLNVQPRFGARISSAVGSNELAAYQQEEGDAALKPARKVLDQAGVPYRYGVGIGEPAETIVQYAIKNRCDQILMGTRGMGSLSGLLLGSVATRVIGLSPVPVVVMKKRDSAKET